MQWRSHGSLLAGATAAWAIFWLAGLPRYYQQYSTRTMVWFDVVVLPPALWLLGRLLRRFAPGDRIRASLWMAFYFTVPLAVYDWLYCGIFLGHGVRFIYVFWYLSVYYVIFWPALPICAYVLNTRDARRAM
jgi:hypothetical protein